MGNLKLIAFEAPSWCAPCRQQARLLEDFNDIPVSRIDIEENPNMANEFNVRNLPTLVILQDNKEIKRFAGLTTIDKIRKFINETN